MNRRPGSLVCCAVLSTALGLSWTGGARGQDGQDEAGMSEVYEPATHPIDRYTMIWEKSPFIVETVVVEQSDGLEKRFALTGMAEVGNKPMVFLLDRRSLERLAVTQGDVSPQGIELVSVLLDVNPRDSKATIRLGGEQAAISFDPASLGPVGGGEAQVPAGAVNVSQPTQAAAPVAVPPPPAPGISAPGVPAANKILRRRPITVPTN